VRYALQTGKKLTSKLSLFLSEFSAADVRIMLSWFGFSSSVFLVSSIFAVEVSLMEVLVCWVQVNSAVYIRYPYHD
jgi:hypothetical protein